MKNRIPVLLLLLSAIIFSAGAGSRRTARPIVSVLGDSYSTFEGHIPQGNAIWYYNKPDTALTDVDDVRQTWWWQVIDRGGFILGKNDSFSGATISFRGYRGEDYRDRSFVTRLPGLGPADIILIFGATNDSWAGVPVGEDAEPGEVADSLLYTFRPAMETLLSEAAGRYPGSEIYFILNSELRPEISAAVIEICRRHSVPCIRLHDIDKKAGHPSRAGMAAIAEQVLEALGATSGAGE